MSSGYEDTGVTVTFQGQEYELRKTRYPAGGATALILWDSQEHDMAYVATVNVPGYFLRQDEVLIKDYSENQGMLKALEDAGAVKATGMTARSGFVAIPVAELQCRLREPSPEVAKDQDSLTATGRAQDEQHDVREPLPSPSEIVRDQRSPSPSPARGGGNERER